MDEIRCSSLLKRNDQYDCEITELEGDKRPTVRRGMLFPFLAAFVTSRYPFALSRSWHHIRENQEQIVILRYVKTGTFSLTQAGVTLAVKPGQFVFSKCTVPFRWECVTDDLTVSEYGAILLQPDLVHRFFSDGVPLKSCLSVPEDRRLALPTLLALLSEEGRSLDPNVARMLVEALLEEARDVAVRTRTELDVRKNICHQRTDDIIAYIELHLSNPELSASAVARSCGISPRYLCYLLKLKNTSFSILLWEQRLKKAREWLLARDTRHYTISEIAYMNGFKTSAHFSRLFRSYFGCSPRELRQSATEEGRGIVSSGPAVAVAEGLPDGICSTQATAADAAMPETMAA